MTDTVGPVEAVFIAIAGERYGTYMFSWSEVMAEARKIDAQLAQAAALAEAWDKAAQSLKREMHKNYCPEDGSDHASACLMASAFLLMPNALLESREALRRFKDGE